MHICVILVSLFPYLPTAVKGTKHSHRDRDRDRDRNRDRDRDRDLSPDDMVDT